jgi:hypothetical protein
MNIAKNDKNTRRAYGAKLKTENLTLKTSSPPPLPTPRKPRSDSPLRMLPAERQAQIIASLETHSARDVSAELLQTDHIKACSGTLTRFRQWYLARNPFSGEQPAIRLADLTNHAASSQNPGAPADLAVPFKLGNRLILVRLPADLAAAAAPGAFIIGL